MKTSLIIAYAWIGLIIAGFLSIVAYNAYINPDFRNFLLVFFGFLTFIFMTAWAATEITGL